MQILHPTTEQPKQGAHL